MWKSRRYDSLAFFVLLGLVLAFTHCRTVKPYQKAYLNDRTMKLGKPDIEKFDESVQTYREGASGGNGKPSGGCGCN
jgi:hypothetical protein